MPAAIDRLIAYCLDWHVSFSGAFRKLLVEPLAPTAEIALTAWNGTTLPQPAASHAPAVFCQLPPPPELLEDPDARLVWIPMWDHASGLDEAWWRSLPPTLRVVAFSREVSIRARAAGLPTLELRYFEDPDDHRPASWTEGPIAFYWNRTGLVGPEFLAGMCRALGVRELLFRGRLDPQIGAGLGYELPQRLGRTLVTPLETEDRDSYLRTVARANVFIAPRPREGVGLTFLEALSRGCAVLAHDAPTMNEYIVHGRNGLLFADRSPSSRTRIARRLRLAAPTPFAIDGAQPWDELAEHSLPELGRRAREDHVAGFARWSASGQAYARFLTDW